MKHILAFFVLLLPIAGWAEDIYVAQNALGGQMDSAAHATNLAWFNTAGNWGSGANKISAGDVVHLVGQITNYVDFQAGGTAGNYITLLFEPGAYILKSATISFAAIYLHTFNYIKVDGGSDGYIKFPDSGTGLADSDGSVGVWSQTPTIGNITVCNLRFTNIFVFTKSSAGSAQSSAIQMEAAGTNIQIYGCTFHRVEKGAYFSYSTDKANGMWQIYSNTAQYCAWLAGGGDAAAGAICDGIDVHHNRNTGASEWETSNNFYHLNSTYFWAETGGFSTGSYITNFTERDNEYGPDLGDNNTTSSIFLSASGGRGIYNVSIRNNVIYHASGMSDGSVELWRVFGALVANNTFSAPGNGVRCYGSTNITFTNDIFNGYGTAIYTPAAGGGVGQVLSSDYNLFYPPGSTNWGDSGTWAAWQGGGRDTHSTTNVNPLFTDSANRNYTLTASSPAIGIAMPLNAVFTVDKLGVTRGSLWDIGAYEFVAAAGPALVMSGRMTLSGQIAGGSFTQASAGLLIDENFEGAGTPSGWNVTAGTPDFDNTSSPLSGAQDLRFNSSVDSGVYKSFTASGEVWVRFEVSIVATPAGGTAYMLSLYEEIPTSSVFLRINTGGQLIVGGPSVSSSPTSDGLTAATHYWVFYHCLKGTGANAVYDVEFSTTSTRTGSGNKFTSLSNGVITTDRGRVYFDRLSSEWVSFNTYQIDNVKVSNTGWPP